MVSRRMLIAGMAALAVAGGLGWYVVSDRADAGAAVTVDAESFAQLRDEFNQNVNDTRLIVLLSPT
ncbi:MAG: hypothetical protein FJW20_25625 [Acidimicrobiia bacterium]|nr:hypothetical protein [Acidimicrobiia bacterium]